MNKLYFASNSINLRSIDLQYLQDNLAETVQEILIAISGNESAPTISKGFYMSVSPSDLTKIKITQNGDTGVIITGDGIIATTTEEYDGIALSDYTHGVINYIYAEYYVANASYDIKNDIIVYEKKAIDLNTYQKVYDRQIDLIEISVYTAAQYAALLPGEQLHCILLGTVTGNGIGIPISSIDISGRDYFSAVIPDNSIAVSKLSSTFLLPQTMVDNSAVINDSYGGNPANVQDDLNKIRTIIKNVKGTPTWDAPSSGIEGSDSDINHLYRSGLFPWNNNFTVTAGGAGIGTGLFSTSSGYIVYDPITGKTAEYVGTSTGSIQGIIVSSGKLLYKNTLISIATSTGLLLPPASLNTVGTYTGSPSGDYGGEDFNITAPGGTITSGTTHIYTAHIPLNPSYNISPATTYGLILTTYKPGGIYYTLTNADFGYYEETGEIYFRNSGVVTSTGTVTAYYQWSQKRIDSVVLSTSSGLTIIEGTPVLESQVPQSPTIPTNAYIIANIHWGEDQTRAKSILQKDITYSNMPIESVRSVTEILAKDINQYDINGNSNLLFIDNVHKLNVLNVSTGAPVAMSGSTYTVISTGDYPYLNLYTGYKIHTDIFTQANDELYISVFPTSTGNYTITVNIETVCSSGIYDTTETITVPYQNIITIPVLLYVYKGFTEGYHKINISSSSIFKMHKIVLGKLDYYYLKNNSYFENISVDKIKTNTITMNWKTGYNYLVGDTVQHTYSGQYNLFQCLVAHTSGTFNTDYTSNYWTSIVSDTNLIIADNTSGDFSQTKHGFVPKANDQGYYLKDDGTWAPGSTDWIQVNETWHTSTGCITSTGIADSNYSFYAAGDMTGKYSKDMKLQLTQSQALTNYWSFSLDAPNSFYDTIGGVTGTAIGGAYVTHDAGKYKWVGALNLDGTGDAVSFSENTFQPTADFTVGTWCKTTTPANMGLFQSYRVATTTGTKRSGICLQTQATTGYPLLYIGNNTGDTLNTNYSLITGKTNVCDNAWHYVVITYKNNMAKIYVDGILDAFGYTLTPVYNSEGGHGTYTRVGCVDLSNLGNTPSLFWGGGNPGQISDLFTIKGQALDEQTIHEKYIANTAQGISNLLLKKYFIINYNGVTYNSTTNQTLISCFGGSDYTLMNATISSPYYAMVETPFRFDDNANKWEFDTYPHRILLTAGSFVPPSWASKMYFILQGAGGTGGAGGNVSYGGSFGAGGGGGGSSGTHIIGWKNIEEFGGNYGITFGSDLYFDAFPTLVAHTGSAGSAGGAGGGAVGTGGVGGSVGNGLGVGISLTNAVSSFILNGTNGTNGVSNDGGTGGVGGGSATYNSGASGRGASGGAGGAGGSYGAGGGGGGGSGATGTGGAGGAGGAACVIIWFF